MVKNSKKGKFPFHYIYSYLLVWVLFFHITFISITFISLQFNQIETNIKFIDIEPLHNIMSRTRKPRPKGKDPNGTRKTRPWTVQEIYDFNCSKSDLNEQYILCDNHTAANCVKPIRQFQTYKSRHYCPCIGTNVSTLRMLPYYQMIETLEWKHTEKNTRKRANNIQKKDNKNKMNTFWKRFKRDEEKEEEDH
eukprot:442559_1